MDTIFNEHKLLLASGKLNNNIKKIIKNNNELDQYIRARTEGVCGDFYDTLNERLYLLYHNLPHPKQCRNCDNHTKFVRFTVGYQPFCSSKCSSCDPERKQLIKLTNIKKYGGTAPMCSIDVVKKAENTSLGRYGKRYHQQTAAGKNTRQQTNLIKYGSRSPLGNKEIQLKSKATMSQLYGKEYFQSSTIPEASYHMLNSKVWLSHKHHLQKTPLFAIADELNVSTYCVRHYCDKHNIKIKRFGISSGHQGLIDFIQTLNIDCDINNRTLLGPQELDIVVPQKQIAVEFNGTYWHSEERGNKNINYHVNKLDACKDIGIKLIHIHEHLWNTKPNIIKSRLKNIMVGATNKIFARKCTIITLPKTEAAQFFNRTHIQGYVHSHINYGLVYNGSVVCAMSFGKPRYNKQCQWELLRLSSELDTVVVGGANKILNHFSKQHNPQNIISYCDRSWSEGDVYDRLGFDFSHTSKPAYWYFHINQTNKVYHRANLQKHKLEDKLETYDSKSTAWKNLQNNGFDRIWDCGNSVWIKQFRK